jgi:diguanylate cyclase (GGDEF)-like protein/PAS domain S-box-containing protein
MDLQFYQTVLDNVYDGVYLVNRERRIMYWNKGAEQITGFTAQEVTGRHCHDNILTHVDSNGAPLCDSLLCPANKTMADGKSRELELYLQHKQGHRIPVVTRTKRLTNATGEILGTLEIFKDTTELKRNREKVAELERLALLDPLTQIGNRRYADIFLHRCFSDLDRYGWPFAVFMIDIDNFKRINDTYGHDAGDSVLQSVARTTVNSVRASDALIRWGGEEFLAVIRNVGHSEVCLLGEKIRSLVERSSALHNYMALRVTVSIGATAALPNDSSETIVARADRFMYQSKLAGRNHVTGDSRVCLTESERVSQTCSH